MKIRLSDNVIVEREGDCVVVTDSMGPYDDNTVYLNPVAAERLQEFLNRDPDLGINVGKFFPHSPNPS